MQNKMTYGYAMTTNGETLKAKESDIRLVALYYDLGIYQFQSPENDHRLRWEVKRSGIGGFFPMDTASSGEEPFRLDVGSLKILGTKEFRDKIL